MTPALARAMAAYNAEMNRRIIRAAGTLADADRRADLGAFFGSLHGTLCHLLWADRLWMHRFAGWERPPGGIAESPGLVADWAEYVAQRGEADAAIEAWARGLDADWLAGEMVWVSSVAKRESRAPRWLLVAHFFNHQTHHRGQAHALLTRLGAQVEDTDLPWVIPREAAA